MTPLSPENEVPEKRTHRDTLLWVLGGGMGCFVVAIILLAGLLIPMRGDYLAAKRGRVCLANVKTICLGLKAYAADHDDRLPPGERWMDDLAPYVHSRRVLRCPAVSGPWRRSGYALNREVIDRPLAGFGQPDRVPAVFDSSDIRRNVLGGLELLPSPARHPDGNTIGFLDGHATQQPVTRRAK